MTTSLRQIETNIPQCSRCPELRSYCAEVGQLKRKSYQDCEYWAKPVPGFGDHHAAIWILGLAPGAHGANRTGRMFSGDRSGDFLFAALHRAGLSNQPTSEALDDGLQLHNVYISNVIRCAPPANKPAPMQINQCSTFLNGEWDQLQPTVRVVLALGGIAWKGALNLGRDVGWSIPRPQPKFGHGAQVSLGSVTLLGSYHVSQQNTFTGRLTEPMFDDLLRQAQEITLQIP